MSRAIFPANKRATLIAGPQGSGKTTLARALAAARGGRWVEVAAESLLDKLFLSEEYGGASRSKPTTIIVDGVIIVSPRVVAKIRDLVTSTTITIQRQGKPPLVANAPHFIFCTSGAEEFLGEGARRFAVIHLGSELDGIGFRKIKAFGQPYADLAADLPPKEMSSETAAMSVAAEDFDPRQPIEITTKISMSRSDGSVEVREVTRRFSGAPVHQQA